MFSLVAEHAFQQGKGQKNLLLGDDMYIVVVG